MEVGLPLLAGTISTVIFAGSMLPMVVKAARTKDLSSYSLGNIVLSNLGNLIHSVYVFHLPAGPVWVLHTFYLVTTALMLVWYLRYQLPRRPAFTKLPRSGEDKALHPVRASDRKGHRKIPAHGVTDEIDAVSFHALDKVQNPIGGGPAVIDAAIVDWIAQLRGTFIAASTGDLRRREDGDSPTQVVTSGGSDATALAPVC
jgi:uncharacterized protein with PQ loop repeat